MIQHTTYNRGNIYLSGGMEHSPDLGEAWRKEASTNLMSMNYFPLDIFELDRAYSNKHGDLYYFYNDDLPIDKKLQFKTNVRKHFIYTDLELVDKDSDAIIVNWDISAALGGGTHNEISHAYERDIPIFIIITDDTKLPGWIRAQASKVFTRWGDLYEYLDKLPFGILKRDQYGNRRAGEHYLCSLCGTPFTKNKHHFVSKISPLYCNSCVDLVTTSNEFLQDRYQFIIEYLTNKE